MKNKLLDVCIAMCILAVVALMWSGCVAGQPANVQVSIVNTEPFELTCLKIGTSAKPRVVWIYPPVSTAALLEPNHDTLKVIAGGVIHTISTNKERLFSAVHVVDTSEFARLIQWLRRKNVTIEVAPRLDPDIEQRNSNYLDM